MDESYVCQSTCAILCLRRTISLLVVNISLSKLANVIDFKAHFPVVSIIFCLLVYFKSWQNRVKVYDRVLMDSDTIFVCFEAVWNSEVFDGDFLPSKNEGKDLFVQRKKCHRSGYFSHIENFSCAMQCTFLNNRIIEYHADHWGNSHRILESRRLGHRRYLYEVLYHFLIPITKEYVKFFLKTIGISP